MASAAEGMHRTVMHSCDIIYFLHFRLDFLQNPPRLPASYIQPKANPGIVQQGAVPVLDKLLGPQHDLTLTAESPMATPNMDPTSLAARLLALQQQSNVVSAPSALPQQPDLSQQTVTMTLQELQNFVLQQGR